MDDSVVAKGPSQASENIALKDPVTGEDPGIWDNPQRLVVEGQKLAKHRASLFSFHNILCLHFSSSKSDIISAT